MSLVVRLIKLCREMKCTSRQLSTSFVPRMTVSFDRDLPAEDNYLLALTNTCLSCFHGKSDMHIIIYARSNCAFDHTWQVCQSISEMSQENFLCGTCFHATLSCRTICYLPQCESCPILSWYGFYYSRGDGCVIWLLAMFWGAFVANFLDEPQVSEVYLNLFDLGVSYESTDLCISAFKTVLPLMTAYCDVLVSIIVRNYNSVWFAAFKCLLLKIT